MNVMLISTLVDFSLIKKYGEASTTGEEMFDDSTLVEVVLLFENEGRLLRTKNLKITSKLKKIRQNVVRIGV